MEPLNAHLLATLLGLAMLVVTHDSCEVLGLELLFELDDADDEAWVAWVVGELGTLAHLISIARILHDDCLAQGERRCTAKELLSFFIAEFKVVVGRSRHLDGKQSLLHFELCEKIVHPGDVITGLFHLRKLGLWIYVIIATLLTLAGLRRCSLHVWFKHRWHITCRLHCGVERAKLRFKHI